MSRKSSQTAPNRESKPRAVSLLMLALMNVTYEAPLGTVCLNQYWWTVYPVRDQEPLRICVMELRWYRGNPFVLWT